MLGSKERSMCTHRGMRWQCHLLLLPFLAALALLSPEVRADGLLMKTNSDTILYHRATHVLVTIDEQVARTVVDFEFVNSLSGDSIWAKFAFPLPEKAVVTDFGVYKGDEIWFFKISASDTARGNQEIPQEDVRLREYLRPNPFVVPVKIGTGRVRFRLKYIEVLDYASGYYHYRYPLATPQSLASAPLDTLSFDLQLTAGYRIFDAECVSHPWLTFDANDFAATLRFSGGTFALSEDLAIRYRLDQPEIKATVFSYRTPSIPHDADGYFAVIFRPPSLEQATILPKYFAFIIDKSGSMTGTPMDYAKQAAKNCIRGLRQEDVFNVIWFNYDAGSFSAEPVRATRENKQRAIDFIESLRPGGSTNLYSPTLQAVQEALPDRVNQVVLLTDGYHNSGPVTNLDRVIQDITSANVHGARIFCFGIGQGADFSFLARLAERNNGKAFKIDTPEQITTAVGEFFEAAGNPVLQVEGLTFEGVSPFEVYPEVLPDLAVGQQVIVTGRYRQGGTGVMKLHAKIAGRDTTFVYQDIALADTSGEYPFVRKLWAKQKIDYLYQQWLALGQPEALRQQIIELSLVYGVLSPFTEFSEPQPPTGVEEVGVLASLQAEVRWAEAAPKVVIEWAPDAGEMAGAVVEIWRSEAGRGEKLLARVPLSAGRYVDAEVGAGRNYRYRVVALDPSGEVLSSREFDVQVPMRFELSQPYPNPFNSSTTIRLTLPRRGSVTVEVRDLLGRVVKELFCGEVQGTETVRWDGTNEFGEEVPSGLYLIRAEYFGKVFVRKVALVR